MRQLRQKGDSEKAATTYRAGGPREDLEVRFFSQIDFGERGKEREALIICFTHPCIHCLLSSP